ncbi:MAG: hypothetical protein Q4D52_00545 [Eubacteriales bacterium]|nr:hypothetical protein [Eubacteriales bacterium]
MKKIKKILKSFLLTATIVCTSLPISSMRAEAFEDGATGWQKQNSSWYYVNEDGSLRTGWIQDGGKWYFLKPRMLQSEPTFIEEVYENGKYYVLDQTGAWVTTPGWRKGVDYYNWVGNVNIRQVWMYIKEDGSLKTGWIKDGGKWYYNSPYMFSDVAAYIDNKIYLFDSSGALIEKAGWQYRLWTETGRRTWYYVNKGGSPKRGWMKENGKWYYLLPQMARDMFLWIGDQYYYFDQTGAMAPIGKTGWRKAKDEYGEDVWYYIKDDKTFATSWLKVNDKKYYFMSNGAMYNREYPLVLMGKEYYFNKDGSLRE